jgi:uncharacterized protein
MAVLTDEMIRVVEEQALGFVASVCADGTPNLSPKGTVSVWDREHLVFADICSPGTVANVRERPIVEINVVDPFRRKGFRFKGPARVVDAGAELERGLRFFRDRGVALPIRSVVLVRVERAEPLISPAYDAGATEPELVERWLRRVLVRLGRAGPS